MQWLAEVCVKRPVFAVMLIAAMTVAGLTCYARLGVARFPSIDLPSLFIAALFPGASPTEMESEVSQVLEDSVSTVQGVDEMRSISWTGRSVVILTLELNRDPDAATQDVRNAISRDQHELPFGTEPPEISKNDLDSSPVLSIAVAGPRDPRELYVLADRYVKKVIESVKGVGEVTIEGTMDRAVQVRIDARRLAAYGLSIVEVRDALARQNTEIPGGMMQSATREFTLRTMGRVSASDDFPDLVVATVKGYPVRLSDLGEVVDGQKELRSVARLNGDPAVIMLVQRQPGANTVDVTDDIHARLNRSRELLPPDVTVSIIHDQSNYIKAAMHEVQMHLISGSFLASLVVFIFMKSWRSALIAAVAIPTSIIATFAAMWLLGFTLNNVTMLALVLMVGVVIDDAIIVLENVYRHIEEYGTPPMQAAIHGTREIGLAVLATTFSLVVVFLPVSFLNSVTGKLLYEFGMTASVSVVVSMLVSFSLTPMMCSRLLKKSPAPTPTARPSSATPSGTHPHPLNWERAPGEIGSRRGFYQYIETSYQWLLGWSMRHRFIMLLLVVGTIAANYPLYRLTKQDYIPTNVDESEFEINITAPEGTRLHSMNLAMEQIESEVRQISGIQNMFASVGRRGSVNTGSILVQLKDISERSFSLGRLVAGLWHGHPEAAWEGNFTQQDAMRQVRDRLKGFPDVQVSVRNLTSFRQGSPNDIDFAIVGPSIEELHRIGQDLLARVRQLPGIVDADTTLKLNKPELLVEIDRERAASLGVDVQEIAETLRIAVGGDEHVSRYRDEKLDDAYDVELRLDGIDRSDTESISQLYVRTTAGNAPSEGSDRNGDATIVSESANGRGSVTRIDNLVDFRFNEAASRIDRLDHERTVSIRANIGSGGDKKSASSSASSGANYALSDRIAAIRQEVEQMGLPEGYSTRVQGRGRELEKTLEEFNWTFALSFVFMYIILAAQFEHFVHPLTILISLPLAVPFGLVSLLWGGETLNLYSALGILVLFGVVKKASILQVDHTNALRAAGLPRDQAIMLANRDRLRPILMTTISFVAGMFPLLIGVGPGAEERRSIAVLAVGGQTLSLLLTLLAVPVIYSLLDDLWLLRQKRTPSATE